VVTSTISPTSPAVPSKVAVNTYEKAQQVPTDKPTASTENTSKKLSPLEQQKASLNADLLESTRVSIGTKNEPLSLILNTALDKINELLSPELGDNAIQQAVDSELDVSPDATAQRIVSMSTAFFESFKAQHQGEEESAVLQNFMQTIGNGIQQGFDEGRDILKGLNVLQGDVASDIDKTFALVEEKLSAFEALLEKQMADMLKTVEDQ